MKSAFKKIIGLLLGNNLSFRIVRLVNKKKLIVIYYHRVIKRKEVVSKIAAKICTGLNEFEQQMKFLSRYFNPISEEGIIAAIENGKVPDYPVWVTFDDGYKDNHINAYPILKKYNVPATIFITTGYVNKQYLPDKELITLNSPKQDVDTENLFMDWDEIRQISRSGIDIGAHTISHRLLSSLPKEEVVKEIVESKNEIERRIEKKVFSFAYPHGKEEDYNLEVCLPILKKCGIKLAVSTMGGANNFTLDDRLLNLNRLGVSIEDSLNFFRFKVSAGSSWQK
jgi:peptidoglycan/xylan/chitin deacetylase (PgdA/CDA1 family)